MKRQELMIKALFKERGNLRDKISKIDNEIEKLEMQVHNGEKQDCPRCNKETIFTMQKSVRGDNRLICSICHQWAWDNKEDKDNYDRDVMHDKGITRRFF